MRATLLTTTTTPTTAAMLSRSVPQLPSLARSRRGALGAARCVTVAASSTSTSGRIGVSPCSTPGLSRPRRLQPQTSSSSSSSPLDPPSAFFGVGAPEAILVGVVALLVFGPKGLAEAVKAAGATLRAFQPTIRELASVSTELRSTLEEQIGLDEIKAELNAAVAPLPATTPVAAKKKKEKAKVEGEDEENDASAAAAAATSDEAETGTETEAENKEEEEQYVDTRPSLTEFAESMSGAEAIDPDIKAKRAAAAAAAWGGNVPAVLSSADAAPSPSSSAASSAAASSQQQQQQIVQGAGLEEALAAAAAKKAATAEAPKSLEGLSIEELEAELARRRASSS